MKIVSSPTSICIATVSLKENMSEVELNWNEYYNHW